jgi:hypothetical protein
MQGALSTPELLTTGPRLVGVPKVKSAFATSVTRPNARTNTSEIVLFILLPFQQLLIFFCHPLCASLAAQVYFKKHLLIECHFGLSPPKKAYDTQAL